ncbi:hypothetical protein ACFL4L_01490 [bacterium]
MKHIFWLLSLFVSMTQYIYSQTSLEEILFENIEDTDIEILENLHLLRSNPVNINSATPSQLAKFPLLTEQQILKIINIRNQQPYQNWTDFKNRTDLETDILQWLPHYFMIKLHIITTKPIIRFNWRERLQRKFPKAKGYQKAYSGSIWKSNHRVEFQIGHLIQGGMLFEKDPGERHWYDHQVGFLSLQTLGNQIKILIGNYRIQTGQGLVLWGSYGSGKSLSPTAALPRSSETIRGYLYNDENHFFTGTAIQFKNNRWAALAFWSDTRKDATIDFDGMIQSFTMSGFHRTKAEQIKKNSAHEKCIGGRLVYKIYDSLIGFTGWINRYSIPVASPNPIRQKFGFHGQANHVIGFDWSTHFTNLQFAGEVAQSRSKEQAGMAYLLWKTKPIQWVILYRNFSSNFQNPYAQGFGFGDAVNEQGFFIGSQIRCTRQTRLNFYMDLLQTPWRTYFLPMPKIKSDFTIQAEHRFSSKHTLSARMRRISENDAANGIINSGKSIETIQDRNKYQIRLDLTMKPKSSCQLRSRLEFVKIIWPEVSGEIKLNQHQENGFLCFQDIRYNGLKKWIFQLRWTCFETNSYASRVYMFENDIPGVLTNTPYYGKGSRWYVLIKWHPRDWGHISFKYGLTYHDGAKSWGNGLDEVTGDTVKNIGLQIDIKL